MAKPLLIHSSQFCLQQQLRLLQTTIRMMREENDRESIEGASKIRKEECRAGPLGWGREKRWSKRERGREERMVCPSPFPLSLSPYLKLE